MMASSFVPFLSSMMSFRRVPRSQMMRAPVWDLDMDSTASQISRMQTSDSSSLNTVDEPKNLP